MGNSNSLSPDFDQIPYARGADFDKLSASWLAGTYAVIRIAALSALATAGCHPGTQPPGRLTPAFGRETLITEEQIAQMSAHTAWDVVRMRSPRFSSGTDSSTGRSVRVRIQEQRSLNADETPLLVVDGMPTSDLDYLNQIPASDIHAIHILDAEAAEPLYGLRAAGGAIIVETKRRK